MLLKTKEESGGRRAGLGEITDRAVRYLTLLNIDAVKEYNGRPHDRVAQADVRTVVVRTSGADSGPR
jgi:hypothetical protein